PRATNQLRQAVAAAREGSWALPTIDTRANIRSCLARVTNTISFTGCSTITFNDILILLFSI
ncbi:MAG: hypothetical protein PHT13_04910, partial [Methanosarcina sp.]|nr:hypothetical protein [Methanosarcina sp.]